MGRRSVEALAEREAHRLTSSASSTAFARPSSRRPVQAMRGLFVTGTDTGVGKTVLSAALLAAMAAGGERVRAFKPVVTG